MSAVATVIKIMPLNLRVNICKRVFQTFPPCTVTHSLGPSPEACWRETSIFLPRSSHLHQIVGRFFLKCFPL